MPHGTGQMMAVAESVQREVAWQARMQRKTGSGGGGRQGPTWAFMRQPRPEHKPLPQGPEDLPLAQAHHLLPPHQSSTLGGGMGLGAGDFISKRTECAGEDQRYCRGTMVRLPQESHRRMDGVWWHHRRPVACHSAGPSTCLLNDCLLSICSLRPLHFDT